MYNGNFGEVFNRMITILAIIVLVIGMVRLAIYWLAQMWWILLIIAVVITAAIIGYRIWRDRNYW